MVDYNVPSPPIDVLDELMENWSIYPAKPKLVFRFQCVPCKTQLLSVTAVLVFMSDAHEWSCFMLMNDQGPRCLL